METKFIDTKSFLRQRTILKSTQSMIEKLSEQLGQEFICRNGVTMKEVVLRAFIEGYEFAEKNFNG